MSWRDYPHTPKVLYRAVMSSYSCRVCTLSEHYQCYTPVVTALYSGSCDRPRDLRRVSCTARAEIPTTQPVLKHLHITGDQTGNLLDRIPHHLPSSLVAERQGGLCQCQEQKAGGGSEAGHPSPTAVPHPALRSGRQAVQVASCTHTLAKPD